MPKIIHWHLYGQRRVWQWQFWDKAAISETYLGAVPMHQSQVPHRQPALMNTMPKSVQTSENLLTYNGFITTTLARAKLLPVLITTQLTGPCSQSVFSWGSVQIHTANFTQPKQIHALVPNWAHSVTKLKTFPGTVSQHRCCKPDCWRRLSAQPAFHPDLHSQNSWSVGLYTDIQLKNPKI